MQDDVVDSVVNEREFQLRKLEEIRAALAEARKSGNWEQVPEAVYHDYLQKIILTSAPALANYLDFKEVDFLSAEHLYSLDVPAISDDPTHVPDHSTAEYQLEQANMAVMNKLRAKALHLNAEAVISVDIKHVLVDSNQQHKQFMVIAVGTAVRFVEE